MSTRRQTGLSLIDALLAMAVLSVAASGFLAALSTSLTVTSSNRERSLALAAAKAQLEPLLGATEAELLARAGATFPVASLQDRAGVPVSGRISVTRHTHPGDDGRVVIHEVQVLVDWLGSQGEEQVALQVEVIPEAQP